MKALVFIHVISAIIGIGPTYFAHVLMRKNQNVTELRVSYHYGRLLEFFPKIGGTIAVITGLILVFTGDYGEITQLWLLGSIILYVMIQVLVIGMVSPRQKKVYTWLIAPENSEANTLNSEIQKLHIQASQLFYVATCLGLLLFTFMILKP